MLSPRNIALGAATLAAAATLFPAGALAAQPDCGDTLKHDVKLTADLDCSGYNGNGLTIGKDGVTVDLNGHTLTGPGSNNYEGIANYEPGYNNVVVKDGTVEAYQYGVDHEYTTGAKILNVTGDNSYNDFYFAYSQNGTIKGVRGSSPNYGIYLYENKNVNVLNSKLNNGGSGGYGVYDYYSRSTLKHVTANGYADGIYVYEPIKGYKVLDSKANDNDDIGIYVYENYPTLIYQATVSASVANDNGNYGLYADVKAPGSGNSGHGNGIADCFHVKC